MRKAEKMSKKSTSTTFDEDAPITQSDIESGKLVMRKQRKQWRDTSLKATGKYLFRQRHH
jgi:hypothetical protein